MPIYGGKGDNAPGVTNEVTEGDSIQVGNTHIDVLFTPCHTSGHVCYLARGIAGQTDAVFTGDTLFVGGCGKFNNGTAKQMYTALITKLARLPEDTLVRNSSDFS